MLRGSGALTPPSLATLQNETSPGTSEAHRARHHADRYLKNGAILSRRARRLAKGAVFALGDTA